QKIWQYQVDSFFPAAGITRSDEVVYASGNALVDMSREKMEKKDVNELWKDAQSGRFNLRWTRRSEFLEKADKHGSILTKEKFKKKHNIEDDDSIPEEMLYTIWEPVGPEHELMHLV
ncbi:unnamed protein product, partial [Amoebophrya sp. A25]